MDKRVNVWPSVLSMVPLEGPHPVLFAVEKCLHKPAPPETWLAALLTMFEAATANHRHVPDDDIPTRANFEDATVALQQFAGFEWACLIIEAYHSGWATDPMAQKLMTHCPFGNNFIIFDKEMESSSGPRGPVIEALMAMVEESGAQDALVVVPELDLSQVKIIGTN